MTEDKTRHQKLYHKTLVNVPTGTVCKLVGVTRSEWGFPGRGKRRGRRGWFARRETHRVGPFHDHRGMMRQESVMKRLLDLGLTKGCTFKVVQGSQHGPVLVEIRGTRIALGHGLASKIVVEEVRVLQ
ncbi:MAG: FeoA family protein [Candidatus Thorarchaeota archaeon]